MVTTDHKPSLGIINSSKPCSTRFERWRLRLMPYEFNLRYSPGKDELNPADYLSRHPTNKSTRDNRGEDYISYVAKASVPNALTLDESDNGPPFSAIEFAAFAKKLGFHHRKITPLWPEANGEAERFVRTVNKFIHACESENSSWKEELPNFLRQFRSTPHSST
ncbi:transposon Ty3-G Gag-Pol polyprotein [Elysia marginata]|uniref:Transposon Ty3-G Gag-Pol polyprotein n=1 Tax=Elysia marginata TaxID=1093978 RepID=A0AAV4H6A9_9GAST|nr:transposon Ty3-G Gag-Pol polyprotein [Elysia marginata]